MGNETNITCTHSQLTASQSRFIVNFGWWLEVCGNFPVCVIGVVLNCITVVVLSSSTMKSNFFNRLLICLAMFDNIYLLCEISEVFRHRFSTYGQQHVFVNFVYPVRSVFMGSSIYMTISLTLERHNAITSPMEYRTRGTTNITKRFFYYVMPVMTFCFIYYIPKFFDLNVDELLMCENGTKINVVNGTKEYIDTTIAEKNCTINYPLIPTHLRVDDNYVFWYINISNFVLTALIPLIVLIYLNCKIYSALNQFISRQPSAQTTDQKNNVQSQQTNDVKKVFILFSIVALFVLCHSLRVILNIEEFINLTTFKEEQKKGCEVEVLWTQVVVPINQMLLIINSSSHFFIYVFMDKGFQQVLWKTCCLNSETQGHNVNESNINTRTTKVSEGSTRIRQSDDIELSNIKVNQNANEEHF